MVKPFTLAPCFSNSANISIRLENLDEIVISLSPNSLQLLIMPSISFSQITSAKSMVLLVVSWVLMYAVTVNVIEAVAKKLAEVINGTT